MEWQETNKHGWHISINVLFVMAVSATTLNHIR